jgi:hypothetical protein
MSHPFSLPFVEAIRVREFSFTPDVSVPVDLRGKKYSIFRGGGGRREQYNL